MSSKSTKALAATAYHEAGHAVASFSLGRTVRRVSIVPDGFYLGHCRHAAQPSFRPDMMADTKARLRAETEIVILLAGGIAEKKFAGRCNYVGASYDHDNAVDLAVHVTGDDAEAAAYLNWLSIRTRNLIEREWAAVRAIADQLLTDRRLSGAVARLTYLAALGVSAA
jgi:hypothetical protein